MKEEKKAVLICFSVKSGKFESHYERNKFFRGLYGWNQVITKERKVYQYRREGLLDEIPHKKVDQSSFIVPEDDFLKIAKFLKHWHDKVIWQNFKVLIGDEIFKDWNEEVEEEEVE